MSQLFKLKEWLTVPEAARHLSIVFGEEINEGDVLRLGLDGRMRLSVCFVNQVKARCGKVVDYENTEWAEIPDITEKSYPLQKMYELQQEKLPAEERGKPLRLMKSLEIGGGRYFNLNGKITHLGGVCDLIMENQGRQDVEQKYLALINGPEITDMSFYGAFVEAADGQTYEICGADDRPLFCFPGGGLPDDGMLVVRTAALREFEQSINSAPTNIEKLLSPTDPAHVSNKLALLKQAAAIHWANVDRDERDTHTNNATVVAWLIERGYSEALANSAATIIRPDWAPVGRKPVK